MKEIIILCALALISACANADENLVTIKESTWVVEDISGQGVIDYLQSSIRFENDGTVNGFAGCNNYFGAATLNGNNLYFGPMGVGRKMCAVAISHQENAFLRALSRVRNYTLTNGILFLNDEDGTTVLRLWQRVDVSSGA